MTHLKEFHLEKLAITHTVMPNEVSSCNNVFIRERQRQFIFRKLSNSNQRPVPFLDVNQFVVFESDFVRAPAVACSKRVKLLSRSEIDSSAQEVDRVQAVVAETTFSETNRRKLFVQNESRKVAVI